MVLKPDDNQLINALIRRKEAGGQSQGALAAELGVSQGHLSKILRQKVLLSAAVRARALRLVTRVSASGEELDASLLKAEVVRVIDASASFRALIRAALDMHGNA